MGKKSYNFLLILIAFTSLSASDTVKEYEAKNFLYPIEKLSDKGKKQVEYLKSIYFEKTEFLGTEFEMFIERMSYAQVNGESVSFGEKKEKNFEFQILLRNHFDSDRVNFSTRRMSYFDIIDIACVQIEAMWLVDGERIIITPLPEKGEAGLSAGPVNPFESKP